ncbi:MAG: 30S ribosomal protein S16 [Acidobacteriota bacterium]|nr:30S ribosomal protein S16 [Acidobacteriota bacterium]
MLKIRLRRMGSTHSPFYRVVVSDSRVPPTGRFVDTLGTYDPGTSPSSVRLDVDRAQAWIDKGARPSPTVKRLLVKARVSAEA